MCFVPIVCDFSGYNLLLLFIYNIFFHNFRSPMTWTTTHEEILCREILTYEPFNYKSGTVQRGESWKLIAESLNYLEDPNFTVSHRSVREKYSLLEKSYKKKNRDEENATGIAPDEPSDLEKALAEIIDKFNDIEIASTEIKETNNIKTAKERETAVEMRKECMETFSETKRRKGEENEASSSKRRRRSGDDTLAYLREKMEIDREFKNRELRLAEQREEMMQNMLAQQQAQTQALFTLLLNNKKEE